MWAHSRPLCFSRVWALGPLGWSHLPVLFWRVLLEWTTFWNSTGGGGWHSEHWTSQTRPKETFLQEGSPSPDSTTPFRTQNVKRSFVEGVALAGLLCLFCIQTAFQPPLLICKRCVQPAEARRQIPQSKRVLRASSRKSSLEDLAKQHALLEGISCLRSRQKTLNKSFLRCWTEIRMFVFIGPLPGSLPH